MNNSHFGDLKLSRLTTEVDINLPTLALQGTAQRFALPALGRGRRSRPTRQMIRRRKLLEICAESPASGARFVSPVFVFAILPAFGTVLWLFLDILLYMPKHKQTQKEHL